MKETTVRIYEQHELAELTKPTLPTTLNTSGIEPIEYKVLIKPKKAEEKTKGGIVLPETVVEKDQHAAVEGEIIAMSPFAFSYEEWPDGARKPQVGDMAVFQRFSGASIRGDDGADYRLMNDKDIMATRRAK